jgi:RNA polymerase sigma-70 factor, ECF subfamily
MELSDHDLLKKYLQGDAQALAVLVDRYRRQVFSFVLGMTSGQEDAEEVFQEVWFRVIRNADKYKDRNFCGWLVRIARNLVIDRARKKRPLVSLDGNSNDSDSRPIELPATGLDPAMELQDGELASRIRAAAESLPKEQREVFLMRTQLDLPFKEIAKLQKTSINTALARMHYAVAKMRVALRQEYQELARGSE